MSGTFGECLEGVGDGGIETENRIDLRHAENLADAVVGAGDAEVPSRAGGLAVRSDKDANAGAVNKGNAGHIENDSGRAWIAEALDEPFEGLGIPAEGEAAGKVNDFDTGVEGFTI